MAPVEIRLNGEVVRRTVGEGPVAMDVSGNRGSFRYVVWFGDRDPEVVVIADRPEGRVLRRTRLWKAGDCCTLPVGETTATSLFGSSVLVPVDLVVKRI